MFFEIDDEYPHCRTHSFWSESFS